MQVKNQKLSDILAPVQSEIEILDTRLINEISPSSRALCHILQEIFKAGGKRLRPALSFLIAKVIEPQKPILEQVYLIAEISELIHTASLVHDDIIDNSFLRRGQPTANSKWDNAITVISGDFMFARAAVNLGKLGENRITTLFAQVLEDLCDGEIRQVEKKFSTEIDWDYYYSKSHKKTGSLIQAACVAPAIYYQADPKVILACSLFGRNLGLAFQIIDDILDFNSTTESMGKPALSDLKDGNITIPILFALEDPLCSDLIKEKIIHISNSADDSVLEEVSVILKQCLAIEKSFIKARELVDIGINALNILPESSAKQSLIDLADYVLSRTN
jgi:all-trans-nonaprenyl-diphosphate synthase